MLIRRRMQALLRLLLSGSLLAGLITVTAAPARAEASFTLQVSCPSGVPVIPSALKPGDVLTLELDSTTCKSFFGGNMNGGFFNVESSGVQNATHSGPAGLWQVKNLLPGAKITGRIMATANDGNAVWEYQRNPSIAYGQSMTGATVKILATTPFPNLGYGAVTGINGVPPVWVGRHAANSDLSLKTLAPNLVLSWPALSEPPLTRVIITASEGKLWLADTLTNGAFVTSGVKPAHEFPAPSTVAPTTTPTASDEMVFIGTTAQVNAALGLVKFTSGASGTPTIEVVAAPEFDTNSGYRSNTVGAATYGRATSGIVYNRATNSFYEAVGMVTNVNNIQTDVLPSRAHAQCLAGWRYFTDTNSDGQLTTGEETFDVSKFNETTCAPVSGIKRIRHTFRGAYAHLANITTPEENLFVRNQAMRFAVDGRQAWIGGVKTNGNWTWASGPEAGQAVPDSTTVNRLSAFWYDGEPNNTGGLEDSIRMDIQRVAVNDWSAAHDTNSGKWIDYNGSGNGQSGHWFIVEYPQPFYNSQITHNAIAGVKLQVSLVTMAPPACNTAGAPSVTNLTDPTFPINTASGYNANYIGYKVTTNNTDVWVGLSNFAGGVVSLAPTQSPNQGLGTVTSSGKPVFFLARATGQTTTAQTHRVTVYKGNPASGTAQTLCQLNSSISAVNNSTSRDSASTVSSVTYDKTSAFAPGEVLEVTVTGNTGTIGAGPTGAFANSGLLALSPVASADFPADAWRLVSTSITAGNETTSDVLRLTGAQTKSGGYTAVYRLLALKPTPTPASLSPIIYKASASSVQFTGSISTLPSVADSLTVSTTVDKARVASQFATDVTYTITVSNSAASAGSIDEITDTLPTGVIYKGVAQNATVPVVEPSGTRTKVTFGGGHIIPAKSGDTNGTLSFTYTATIPASIGTFANSAVAYLGATQIGASGAGTIGASVAVKTVAPPVVAATLGETPAGTAKTVTPVVTTGDAAVTVVESGSGAPCLISPADNTCTTANVTVASRGTWSLSGRAVTFTPTMADGTESIQYRVLDSLGQSATSAVTILVAPIPVVEPKTVDTTLGRSVNANMTVKETAVAAAPVVTPTDACLVDPASGACADSVDVSNVGTFTILGPENELLFAPAGAYTGTATVTYVATYAERQGANVLTVNVANNFAMDTASLSAGNVEATYSRQLSASGGSGSYVWTLAEGPLPDGMSLSPEGVLSGQPTQAESRSFTVAVCDRDYPTLCVERTFTLSIGEKIVVVPAPVEPVIPKSAPTITQTNNDGTVTLTCVAPEFTRAVESTSYVWLLGSAEVGKTRSITVTQGDSDEQYTCRVTGFSMGSTGSAAANVVVAKKVAPPTTPITPTTPTPPAVKTATSSVFFGVKSSVITAAELRRLRTFVARRGVIQQVTVTGFVQAAGTTANDRALSAARANQVVRALRSMGVKVKIVTKVGGRSKALGAKGRVVTITVASTTSK